MESCLKRKHSNVRFLYTPEVAAKFLWVRYVPEREHPHLAINGSYVLSIPVISDITLPTKISSKLYPLSRKVV